MKSDSDAWLAVVAEEISQRMDAPSVRVWSLSPDEARLRLRTTVGLDIPFAGLQKNVPVDGSELGQVVTSGLPYLANCDNPATPPDVGLWAARERITSFLAVPIPARDRMWGVLGVFTHRRVSPAQQSSLIQAGVRLGQNLDLTGSPHSQSHLSGLLPSLMPCLSAAVVTLDGDGNVTHWSAPAEKLFGWQECQVLGRPLPIVPEERQHEFAMPPTGLRVNRTRTVCRRADLRPVPVERTAGPLLNEHGQVIGRIEVLTDDSRRVETSRCLEVQGRIATILAGCLGTEDGIPLLLAALGEWLACDVVEFWQRDNQQNTLARAGVWAKSPTLRDRLSATNFPLKVDSQDWTARAHQQDDFSYEAHVGDADPRSKTPSNRLAVPIHRDGHRFGVVVCRGESLEAPEELIRQTLRFSANALAQFLSRLEANDALTQAEANLRQSQKMDAIGLLAGGVAHDFNNLLTVILAYSEMGLDEIDDTHPLHELFAEIHGAGARAAAMTRQLLAVSRQQPTRPVACNLNDLITDMDRMFRRLLGPEIALVYETCDELGTIHADVNQMEQVLLNFIVNARDAMEAGGTITVTTRNVPSPHAGPHRPRGQKFVELSVTDTGCGMDETTRSQIFDPFFTTKQPGKGTGMGLSTVFGIIKQNGGSIDVDSELGVGTTFSIRLPRRDEIFAIKSIDQKPEAVPNGTETVLVVEPDDAIRTLLRRLLQVRGYTILDAEDGDAALEILNTRRPSIDLVLADAQIRVAGGETLNDRLASCRQKPNRLLMSSSAQLSAEADLGCELHFLPKPFTSVELARQVRGAIDVARSGNVRQ